MNDLDQVQHFYKNSYTEKLIELSKQPEVLKREVIPLLQKELLERGQKEEVQLLDDYLSKPIETKNENNGIAQIVSGIVLFLLGLFMITVFASNNIFVLSYVVFVLSYVVSMVLGIMAFSMGIKNRKKYKKDNEKH